MCPEKHAFLANRLLWFVPSKAQTLFRQVFCRPKRCYWQSSDTNGHLLNRVWWDLATLRMRLACLIPHLEFSIDEVIDIPLLHFLVNQRFTVVFWVPLGWRALAVLATGNPFTLATSSVKLISSLFSLHGPSTHQVSKISNGTWKTAITNKFLKSILASSNPKTPTAPLVVPCWNFSFAATPRSETAATILLQLRFSLPCAV